MMHIIKNFFEKLTFKLFGGERVPRWSTAKCPKPVPSDPDYDSKLDRYTDSYQRWRKAVAANDKCIFTEAQRKAVDKRVKTLVGPANWIKNSMVINRINTHTYT